MHPNGLTVSVLKSKDRLWVDCCKGHFCSIEIRLRFAQKKMNKYSWLWVLLIGVLNLSAQTTLGDDDKVIITEAEAEVLDTLQDSRMTSLAGKKVAFITGYHGKSFLKKSDFFYRYINKNEMHETAKVWWLTPKEKEKSYGFDAVVLSGIYEMSTEDRAWVVSRLGGYALPAKNVYVVGTFHQKNVNIHGVSVGAFTGFGEPRYTRTNGLRLELIGIGIFMPIMPQSPIAQDSLSFASEMREPVSEVTNGVSLSLSGGACSCVTNGMSIGGIGQINQQVNGVSASLFMNMSQKLNGLQLALWGNESYETNGLQIGLINQSHKLKGLQFGLWNVNEKRSLPVVNWNF